jgi:hypothetical protein
MKKHDDVRGWLLRRQCPIFDLIHGFASFNFGWIRFMIVTISLSYMITNCVATTMTLHIGVTFNALPYDFSQILVCLTLAVNKYMVQIFCILQNWTFQCPGEVLVCHRDCPGKSGTGGKLGFA